MAKGTVTIKETTVHYGKDTDEGYLGRNGYGKCSGVVVSRVGNETVLTPINTRGPARCFFTIPEESIQDVVAAIKSNGGNHERITCKFCGSSNTTVVDTKDAGGEGHDVYVCQDCGHEGKAHYRMKYTEIE